jgi:hypothetical protein
MKQLLSLTTLFFVNILIHAQELKPFVDRSNMEIGGRRSEIMSLECSGLVNPPSLDLNYRPSLSLIFREKEHIGPNEELVEKIKLKKTETKEANQILNRGPDELETTNAVIPEIGLNFKGNEFDGSAPADNNVAISTSGYIVSVANSTIVYAKNGVVTYYQSLEPFVNEPSWNTCDPVVLFDTDAKRFIMYLQECGVDDNNYISILFSKSGNPADGWWLYKMKGDQSGNGYFFDYPKIAISTNDFFLTANLFSNSGTVGAMVIQMDKKTGYNAQTLKYVYYDQLAGMNFSLLPVGYGIAGTYGPGIYLVASDRKGGNKISLYNISNDYGKNPQIYHSYLNTTAYSLPGDAIQKGNNCKLSTGDCRALSGFYLNEIIHFVFCSDYGDGYGGINYHRINVKTNQLVSDKFGYVGYDYAYPAVASFASSVTDKSVMIGFGRVSKDFNPQIRVVNVDDAFKWSNSTYVYELWDVDCFSGKDVQRWGDYSGATRNYSVNSPSVYINGAFGNFDGGWDTRIAEVHSGGPYIAVTDLPVIKNALLFPNPATNRFNIKFLVDKTCNIKVNLISAEGKFVHQLFSGRALWGENNFSFNQEPLPDGIYFIQIINDTKTLVHEKLVIQH